MVITTGPDGTRGQETLATDADVLTAYHDLFGVDLPHRPRRKSR